MSESLQLRAADADDFAVLGACLQDALVPVHDMCFLKDEKRFVMVANRFCWEKVSGEGAAETPGSYERVHCGITFEHVTHVQAKGFTPGGTNEQGRLLEVLTILAEGDEVTVVFAGGAAVKLAMSPPEAFLQDVGEPWPTMWRPHHPVEDELDQGGGTR